MTPWGARAAGAAGLAALLSASNPSFSATTTLAPDVGHTVRAGAQLIRPGNPGALAPLPFKLRVIDASGNGADGVDVADVNGDGRPDVVSGWEQEGKAKIYRNPTAEGLKDPWPATEVNGGLPLDGIEDAVFADFDGDGRVDGVVSSTEGFRATGQHKLGIHWLQNKDEPFWDQSWKGTWVDQRTERWMKADVGQIDGKNGHDILVGTKTQGGDTGELFWYEAPKDPSPENVSQWKRHYLTDLGWAKSVKLVDMNEDGHPDALYGDRNVLAWLENPGPGRAGTEAWRKHVIEPGLDYFEVCDLDGDGKKDIVAALGKRAQEQGRLARWFRQTSPGQWVGADVSVGSQDKVPGKPGDFVLKGIAAADFDGDGKTDLAMTASGEGHGVFVLRQVAGSDPGDPNARWEATPVDKYRRVMKFDNVKAHDIDGDGDPDIVTTEENVGLTSHGLGVVMFENKTK